MKITRAKILIATSIVPQILLMKFISLYPEKVELYFSQIFYPKLFSLQQFFVDPIPFSIGDLIYLLLGVYIFYLIVRFLMKLKLPSIKILTEIGAFISVLFLIFQLSWGINYHRTPLTEKLKIQDQYSDSLLIELTNKFLRKSNSLHNQLSKSDTLAVSILHSKEKIAELIQNSYSDLNGNRIQIPKVKASLFSLPLSYMGFAGYLNPFTLEAQVNMRMPKINLPVTIAHEISHQLGYAAENEANFIGFVNAFKNKDPYIQYAAVLFGFRYCLIDLRKRNPEHARVIIKDLNLGILKNFAESEDFWKGYKNPLEPYFKKSYDTYLKANGQKSGIKTYNQMVAFLISFDLEK